MSTRVIPTVPAPSPHRVRRRRWFSVLLAMAAATLVRALADMGGIDLEVTAGGGTRTIGQLQVTITTLAIGLAAWGLLELLERRTAGSHRIWGIVAGLVLVVSLAGPLGAETGAAGAVLAGLHLLVGAVLIAGLGRSPRLGSAPGPAR